MTTAEVEQVDTLHITEAVGVASDPVSLQIEPGRLRLFAKATGQSDSVYTDVAAARAAGLPGLAVPPTFLFSVELERPDPFAWLTRHGVAMSQVLHGEQEFSYLAPVYAGDTVVARSVISDVQVKKNGALTLVTRTTVITRDEHPVAELTTTLALRGGA